MKYRRDVGAVLAAMVMVGACGNDDDPTPTPDLPTSETSPAESPSPTDDAAAQTAAVENAYNQFWVAVIESENAVDDSHDQFAGLAAEPVIQEQIARIRGMAGNGLHREGTPQRQGFEAEVDGQTARVQECVDEGPWITLRGEETLDADDRGFVPRVFDMELVDGQWIVTARVDLEEATIQC